LTDDKNLQNFIKTNNTELIKEKPKPVYNRFEKIRMKKEKRKERKKGNEKRSLLDGWGNVVPNWDNSATQLTTAENNNNTDSNKVVSINKTSTNGWNDNDQQYNINQ